MIKAVIRAVIKWAISDELFSLRNYSGHTSRLIYDVAEMRGNRMRIYAIEKHLGLTNSFHAAEIWNDNAFAGFDSEPISEREVQWDADKHRLHQEKYFTKKVEKP